MRPIYYDESLENLESKVNKELRSLWLGVNKLSLNIEQNNFGYFSSFQQTLKIQLHNKNSEECYN